MENCKVFLQELASSFMFFFSFNITLVDVVEMQFPHEDCFRALLSSPRLPPKCLKVKYS